MEKRNGYRYTRRLLRSEGKWSVITNKMKIKWVREGWFDKVAVGFGLLVLSPFILAEFVVMGFQWLIKKIKRK